MTVPGSSAPTAAARTAVVWCPDWAVTAARHAEVVPVGTAVVVVARGTRGVTVQAASPEARAAGITVGIRRREAEGLCPDLTVIDDDPMRNGRAFEAVARAVEGFTPRLVLERPGRLSFPTRGPSRYFGGDDTLAALVIVALDEHGFDTARLGIADGLFAAGLAARAGGHARVRIVAPGESAAFLAPLPVGVLGDPELASVLSRLGLRTLAAFHALPAPDVLARFGRDGFDAYQRAAGLDDEPVTLTIPPAELTVMHEFDRRNRASMRPRSRPRRWPTNSSRV
jgi:protein ImuB